jgi:hypothetical protein
MPTKKRMFLTDAVPRISSPETYNNGILVAPGSTSMIYFSGVDQATSFGHPWPPSFAKSIRKKFRNVGGPCVIQHRIVTNTAVQVDIWDKAAHNVGIARRYTGLMTLSDNNGASQSVGSVPASLSDSTLIALGTKAFAQYKPTASKGGLGQALGELRQLPTIPDFLKQVKESLRNGRPTRSLRKYNSKRAASDYLNVEFGWVPLVSDILDLIKNIQNIQKNLNQLERDNGRPVRRGGRIGSNVDTSTSVTTTGSGNGGTLPSLSAGMYSGPWTKTVTTQNKTDYRFSGRFRYFIDFNKAHRGDLPQAAQLTRILLGAEISPHVLYQLMPWSWLADWFGSTGAILNNLVHDPQDNLVADYAYINGKTTQTIQIELKQKLQHGTPAEEATWLNTVETSTFKRIAASPYGFGILLPNLSLRQKAVLVALGLSKFH